MAIHKAMMMGAEARGEEPPRNLAQFQSQGGLFTFGSMMFNWISGYMCNDALRGKYVLTEMQKECDFAPGEFMMVEGSSFPVFAQLYGGRSHWVITDAAR